MTASTAIAAVTAWFKPPPLPLPPYLQRPWTDAEVAVVALHMDAVTPWSRVWR